ncbi:hypothetical protein UA08_09166 [Talaromyces atroroseus]|uniref:Uncharacterized protein n=1 Tax=Talaromyces atroroseus TaxID=1441469 RepID=A0A1Q5Q6S8_TALAT|nr:hypothetical protein UA08_09166 [Talaromyces atroroseus]OKL55549.1 hypothetical protein UA08_09166 [Talaromyces atroroseus]
MRRADVPGGRDYRFKYRTVGMTQSLSGYMSITVANIDLDDKTRKTSEIHFATCHVCNPGTCSECERSGTRQGGFERHQRIRWGPLSYESYDMGIASHCEQGYFSTRWSNSRLEAMDC